MYCFQHGSEVIGIKREATDTQEEQQNSAVAITFTEIKGEEEVSCIALYPLLFVFSNIFLQSLYCHIDMLSETNPMQCKLTSSKLLVLAC
jgi:hypothetical protein